MKKVSIVYSQPLTQIQGINYVNNSFVMGGEYFRENGLLLDKIYAPDCVFDCTTHDRLDLIGSNVNTPSYQRERKVRTFLRKLLSSNNLIGASIKIFFNFKLNAKKTVERLASDDSDYLIFQDLGSVREYFKKYGKKRKTKTILILHCSKHPLEQVIPSFHGYYKYSFLKKRALKRCDETMHLVDKVVYLNNNAVSFSPLKEDKKTYVYNGVEDISNWSITEASDQIRLVCVANLSEHKGQTIIIEALRRLPKEVLEKVKLSLVGTGLALDECMTKVKRYDLDSHVSMLGQRNDVAEILKSQDVFVLPSISEGMPMSIIEAMRQGLYIMATPVGGILEMIEPEYGEFISRNPQELADAIVKLVNNHKVTESAKLASRQRFEKDFNLKSMINGYSNVLHSL